MTLSPSELDTMIDLALVQLDDVSGGASLCTMTRAGRSVPAAKYLEGRVAALMDLRRFSAQAATAWADVGSRWADDLERLVEQGAGADWIAYAHGGVDATTEVLGR